MLESLYIAETGMSSQQRLLEAISNNIANVSTPGFKKSQLSFVDLVYRGSAPTPAEIAPGSPANGAGVQVSADLKDFSVGDLKHTGNPFDIAIQGAGFIEVELDNNQFGYTRAGRLRIDNDGYLTTSEGHRLSARIQLPPDAKDIVIRPNGEVSAKLGDRQDEVTLGQIELAQIINLESLDAIGNNLYQVTANASDIVYAEPGTLGVGQIAQGVTELSNVSMTEEMVNLMLAQRGYQLNARIIQVSDQILDTINNLRR